MNNRCVAGLMVIGVLVGAASGACGQAKEPERLNLEGLSGSPHAMVFSGDGATFGCVGLEAGTLKAWDLSSGRMKKTVWRLDSGRGLTVQLRSVAFSRDGKKLAV